MHFPDTGPPAAGAGAAALAHGPFGRWLLALLAALMMGGCALAPPQGRSESRAPAPAQTADTRLGRALVPQAAAHAGQSGILPLEDAQGAFAARMLLAHAAERTLDVQYYIWRGDVTGSLLLQALHEAAERGVRVRLLLDDNGVSGLDAVLAELGAHPNIEVRLFNPFTVRSPKALGYLTHFGRANRRMHNKSFTADNQATIVGGRNVGDEYFGATEGTLFADLDVLAAGAVVPEVSGDFDRYWASESAYPIDRVVAARTAQERHALQADVARAQADPRAARYVEALRASGVIDALVDGTAPLRWSRVQMVSDDPAKGLGRARREEHLLFRLGQVLGRPEAQVDLVSPYFVPTAEGAQAFADLVARGVRLRVLTNALEATDVAAVHAGYAKRRKALLQAGVRLYEMRRQPGGDAVGERARLFGSSGSSLHAKTFAVDRQRIFVGSFNFDPRSAALNTELGFVIDDPSFAETTEAVFDHRVPLAAYEVRLDPGGSLYWVEVRDGREIRHDREPGTSLLQRLGVGALSLLPIEWLL